MQAMRFPNRILLLMGIFFSCVELFAQKTPSKMFCKLSGPEKAWVIFHPFIAKKTWKITEQARMETKSLLLDPRLDGDEDGGQLDAFRHAFWMASLSQKICWRKALKLGIAHEKGNYKKFKKHLTEDNSIADSMATVMDLFNNAFGIELSRNKPNFASDSLRETLILSILKGDLRILWKNEEGKSLNCEGDLLKDNKEQIIWKSDRCLVPSDRKRKPTD